MACRLYAIIVMWSEMDDKLLDGMLAISRDYQQPVTMAINNSTAVEVSVLVFFIVVDF